MDAVLHILFCADGAEFGEYRGLLEWDHNNYGRIHEIRGDPQSGKTYGMLSLATIRYFKYGQPCILIPRSAGEAYSDIKKSVEDFNAKILEAIIQVRGSAQGVHVEDYQLKYCCTADSARGRGRDRVEGWIRETVPLVYSRIGSAGNVRTLCHDWLPLIARSYGITEDGYINALVLIDESHNTHQDARLHTGDRAAFALGRSQLQRAVHHTHFETLEDAIELAVLADYPESSRDSRSARRAVDRVKAQVRGRCDGRGRFTLLNCVRDVVNVSATHTPSHINQRTYQRGNVVEVPLPPGRAAGFSPLLQDHQRIQCHAIETVERVASEMSIEEAVPGLFTVVDERMDREGFDHTLTYLAIARNARIDETIDVLRKKYRRHDKPLILISAYATSTDSDGVRRGARITGNRAAYPILKHLVSADRHLHYCPGDNRKPPDHFWGDSYACPDGRVRKLVRKGGNIPLHGKVRKQRRRRRMDVRLPKAMQYRIRATLDIVQRALSVEGADLANVKIVTVGRTLLKEGVVVKTNDHNLAPTGMVLTGALKTLRGHGWNHVRTKQAAARIASPYLRDDQRIPEFFAPQEIIDQNNQAYSCQLAMYEAVDLGNERGQAPRQAIRAQNVAGYGDMPDGTRIAARRQMDDQVCADVRHGSTLNPDATPQEGRMPECEHSPRSLLSVQGSACREKSFLLVRALCYHPNISASSFRAMCNLLDCRYLLRDAHTHGRHLWLPSRRTTRRAVSAHFRDPHTGANRFLIEWSGRARHSNVHVPRWLQVEAIRLYSEGGLPACPCGRSECPFPSLEEYDRLINSDETNAGAQPRGPRTPQRLHVCAHRQEISTEANILGRRRREASEADLDSDLESDDQDYQPHQRQRQRRELRDSDGQPRHQTRRQLVVESRAPRGDNTSGAGAYQNRTRSRPQRSRTHRTPDGFAQGAVMNYAEEHSDDMRVSVDSDEEWQMGL